MSTVVTGDAKAARDKRRKELLEELLAHGGEDVESLRDVIRELVEELPTPALEQVVETITAKQAALGETIVGNEL